jgi:hypothetical protein
MRQAGHGRSMLAFRSVVSVLVRFVVRSFSTPLRSFSTPSRSHPPSRSVTAVNKISADINQSLNIEFRFRPGTLHIKHGATLTFREGPPQPPFAFPEGVDPHTLSIVRRADLPRRSESWSTARPGSAANSGKPTTLREHRPTSWSTWARRAPQRPSVHRGRRRLPSRRWVPGPSWGRDTTVSNVQSRCPMDNQTRSSSAVPAVIGCRSVYGMQEVTANAEA